jgi:Caspase domain
MLGRVGLLFAIATAMFAAAPAQAQQRGALAVTPKVSEAPGAPDAARVELYKSSKALVIGIDNYDGRGWGRLSKAIADAREVAKGLTAQGFAVTLKEDLKSADLAPVLQ